MNDDELKAIEEMKHRDDMCACCVKPAIAKLIAEIRRLQAELIAQEEGFKQCYDGAMKDARKEIARAREE